VGWLRRFATTYARRVPTFFGHRACCGEGIGQEGEDTLKQWTFASMIVTNVRDRGAPWMRLLLSRRRGCPSTLSVRPAEQRLTLLAAMSLLSFGAALSARDAIFLMVAVLLSTAVAVGNRRLFSWFAERRGVAFARRPVPLRLSGYYLNVLSVFLALALHVASGWQAATATAARGEWGAIGILDSHKDPPTAGERISTVDGGAR